MILEDEYPDRLPCNTESEFVLMLSGGGHRATLYSLGALMAVVDAEANRRVKQISSVSGGSITNMVVANACDFHETYTEEFEKIAKNLFETVVHGVLTRIFLFGLFAIVFGPVLMFVVASLWGWLPDLEIILPICFAWLVIILLRGIPIEILFNWYYFRKILFPLNFKSLGAVPVDERPMSWEKLTEHVVCCTDLVSGKPVYFSTFNGGKVYSCIQNDKWPGYEINDVGKVSAAAILRASAGFPGIPPRRFQLVNNLWTSRPWPISSGARVSFLADGGVWNNLATQTILEDNFYHGVRVYPPSIPGICLDASGPLDVRTSWGLHIPGLAEIQALTREVNILNSNTVSPRRRELDHDFANSIEEGYFSGVKPFVASLSRSPADIAFIINRWLFSRHLNYDDNMVDLERHKEYWHAIWNGDEQVLFDQQRLDAVLKSMSGRRSVWYRVIEMLNTPEYKQLCEFANIDSTKLPFPVSAPFILVGYNKQDPEISLNDVLYTLYNRAEGALKRQAQYDKDSRLARISTTLGGINRKDARDLVVRGYVNTLVSLYMIGLIDSLPGPGGKYTWLESE